MRKRKGPSPETKSIYGPLTARASMPRVEFYRKGERPASVRTTSAYSTPQATVEEPHPDAPPEVEQFEGAKPFNLTLVVAPERERDKFNSLEHKHTYREIRPNRAPEQRGAYQVEMTYLEYQRALEDTRDPDVNLIAVEPEVYLRPHSIPGTAVETYMDMGCQGDLGLDGKGVDVGIVEYGYGPILTNFFAGRVKAKQGFGGANPDSADDHGAEMVSLAVPPAARVVAAAYDGTDTTMVAAFYWMVDEVGVHLINCSQGSFTSSTIKADAIAHIASKNVYLFVSRGNEGTNQAEYPASYAQSLAISNYIPSTGEIDPQSSFGSVFAAAAGKEMYYMQPNGTTETYDEVGGTSEAAAAATRTAALLLSGGASFGNLKATLEKGAKQTGAGSEYEGVGVLQLCTSVSLNTPPAPPNGSGSAIGPGSTSETTSGAGGSGDAVGIGGVGGDPTSPECIALQDELDAFSASSITAQDVADYLNANFGIDLATQFPTEWALAAACEPQQVVVTVCELDITFTLDCASTGTVDPHVQDISLSGPMSLTRTGRSPNAPGTYQVQLANTAPPRNYDQYTGRSLPEGVPLDIATGLIFTYRTDRGNAMLEQKDPTMTLTITEASISFYTSDEAAAFNSEHSGDPGFEPLSEGFYARFVGEFHVDRYWRWWQYVPNTSGDPTYLRSVQAGWPIVLGVQQRTLDQPTDGDIWKLSAGYWQFSDWAQHDIISGTQSFFTTGPTYEACGDPADQFDGTIQSGNIRLPNQTDPTNVAFFLMSIPEFFDKTGFYVPIRGSWRRGTDIPGYLTPPDSSGHRYSNYENFTEYESPPGTVNIAPLSSTPESVWLTGPVNQGGFVYGSAGLVKGWMNFRHAGTDDGWYYERGPWTLFDPNATGTTETVITDVTWEPSGPSIDTPELNPGLDLDNPPTMDMPMPFPDFPFPDMPCVSIPDVGVSMCMEDMTMPELPMPCFPDFPFGDCPPSPGTGSGIGDFGPSGEVPNDGMGNGVGTGLTAGKDTFAEDKCFPAGTSLGDAINELSDMLGLDADQMTIEGTCDDTLENGKCFPKGSSIWDAIWWLSDQCGMVPIDGGDTVTIANPTPLDTTWILNEYTNLFDFTPVLDSSELFWGVEVFRAEITKGGTVITPGLEVLVQVPTVFAVDPQEIFRVSVDPGITETEATNMAVGLARKMGRISFRVTATTFFNPNVRLRHRIRIVRSSKNFDMEFMCTSITHDLSETGKFTTVEAQVILDDPIVVEEAT